MFLIYAILNAQGKDIHSSCLFQMYVCDLIYYVLLNILIYQLKYSVY